MRPSEDALEIYAERHSGKEPTYLKELRAETLAKVHSPEMLSGHLQGRTLALLSRLLRPQLIVEIGTYTGYSALCLAEGLSPGGMLHTIDIDPHLPPLVHRYIAKAGMQDRIATHHRPALEVIPTLQGPFDLVFIDADKQNYPSYLTAVIERVRSGGLIIADNVLWSGRVLQPSTEQDEVTKAIATYSRMVNDDPRLDPVLLPVRDGLLIAHKR
ncbi:MAG: O-methyltransferase [Flavobacteriales bacterium]